MEEKVGHEGTLTVIVGPMFADKSKKLVDIIDDQRARGRTVVAFKPDFDTRQDGIRSRTGQTAGAFVVPRNGLWQPLQALGDVVVIDEAHMFELPLVTTVMAYVSVGVDVVVAGVDYNYRTKPFPTMMALLERADCISRHFAYCGCGDPAFYTRRKNGEESELLVGDEDLYEPICVLCLMATNDDPKLHLHMPSFDRTPTRRMRA